MPDAHRRADPACGVLSRTCGYNALMVLGVISDTHGLLRAEAREALKGCQQILHAGDVGDATVLDELARLAPVTAVRGNIDNAPWAARLPVTEMIECGDALFYLLHRIDDLDLAPAAAGIRAVVFGHSHRPRIEWRDDILFFNPGSAGPRRFSLPVTVGKIEIVGGALRPEIFRIL